MSAAAPDFDGLLERFRRETEGLSDAQLDWEDASQEWSRWSIRRQISHVALAYFFWLAKAWGKTLWPEQPPPDPVDFSRAARYDRRLDEEVYWRMEDLWPKFEEAIGLARRAAEGKSEEEMHALTLTRTFPRSLKMGATEEKVWAFWAGVAPHYPGGITQHPDDETTFTFTLAGMLRHLYYEALVHLRTIQRLKAAQGLPSAVPLPREGLLREERFWGPEDGGS